MKMLFLLFTALSLSTFSNLTLAQVRVVTEHLPPYQTAAKNGEAVGYAAELVEELLAESGDKAHIEVLPWARAYKLAQEEASVLIFSIARAPHREQNFNWIGKICTEKLHIYGLRSKFTYPIKHLEDLRDYSIATSQASNPEQYLSRQGFQNLHRVSSPYQNMAMLFRGRVDLVIGTEAGFRIRAKKMNLDYSKMIPVFSLPELNQDLYVALSKATDSNTVKRYTSAFKKLQQNGRIASLLSKWQIDC